MKTMKKLIIAVLSVVLIMSAVSITSFAADYTDFDVSISSAEIADNTLTVKVSVKAPSATTMGTNSRVDIRVYYNNQDMGIPSNAVKRTSSTGLGTVAYATVAPYPSLVFRGSNVEEDFAGGTVEFVIEYDVSNYEIKNGDIITIGTGQTKLYDEGYCFGMWEGEGIYSPNEIFDTYTISGLTPAAPTFEASLANVTAGPVAKDETFTADVVLTSDTVPASAALDLNVSSDVAKIVSITPAEGIGTTESTVATDGASGKVSFYGNTASAADGLKVATVTFEAVADGTADISLASEGAGVSGDPADYDITVPESATEVIVKSPTVEAVDFGGSYQLVKYTPNAPIAEGMTVKYGDQEMYLADGSWYCVIGNDTTPSLDSVTIAEGAKTDYTAVDKGDVNENGKINIIDAQIAYDIANSVYTGFEKLTVTGVLKADVNNDRAVDAQDARAIQVYVHNN